jgi:hypothetical protein
MFENQTSIRDKCLRKSPTIQSVLSNKIKSKELPKLSPAISTQDQIEEHELENTEPELLNSSSGLSRGS